MHAGEMSIWPAGSDGQPLFVTTAVIFHIVSKHLATVYIKFID